MNFQALRADTLFRPERFFLGHTGGAGVVRDPFGRLVRRCTITTTGARREPYGAIGFDETFTYDDGEVDIWRWVVTASPDGRYMSSEALAGSGIVGERIGDEYTLSFRRPVGRARGVLAPHFHTRFTLLSPAIALKAVKVSLHGVPMGTLTAVHQRETG